MGELVSLQGETRECAVSLSFSSSLWGYKKAALCKPGGELSPDLDPADTLIWDVPASGAVINTVPLCKPPNLWHLVTAAPADYYLTQLPVSPTRKPIIISPKLHTSHSTYGPSGGQTDLVRGWSWVRVCAVWSESHVISENVSSRHIFKVILSVLYLCHYTSHVFKYPLSHLLLRT